MSTIIIYAVIALSFIGALGGIYAKGYYSGKATVTAEWQEANEKARAEEAAKGAAAATKLEDSRGKSKIVYRTIKQEVEKIVARVEYRDRPCLDPRGLQFARCAILGKSADSCVPDKPVPATPAPNGRLGSYGPQMDHRIGGTLLGLR